VARSFLAWCLSPFLRDLAGGCPRRFYRSRGRSAPAVGRRAGADQPASSPAPVRQPEARPRTGGWASSHRMR